MHFLGRKVPDVDSGVADAFETKSLQAVDHGLHYQGSDSLSSVFILPDGDGRIPVLHSDVADTDIGIVLFCF